MIAIPPMRTPTRTPGNGGGLGDVDGGGMSGLDTPLQTRLPCCLARENIAYDVAEVLWPDPNRRQGAP